MRLRFALIGIGLQGMGLLTGQAEEGKKLNHLAAEKSPYLQQHATNPVDWYPWGEEAFAKARKEQKPIFLSIGYSTCHWCHVMERESFENEELAAILNKNYVSIKLDREERPDVDRVYMTAFQAMNRQGGGWPLNMFLTPDLKPFFGGTYFPPVDRGGRAGFGRVLEQISQVWKEQREEVISSANDSTKRLQELLAGPQALAEEPERSLVRAGVTAIAAAGDRTNGGWGPGPKFPQPSQLLLLLKSGDKKEQDFALFTCRKMLRGGIYDQVGGGFHRYAVDAIWLVPHFEKMLYDQGQLLDVYTEAWLVSRDPEFKRVAREIADYVLAELRHEKGGFFSAQDAQSEGKEGKSYCWTAKELKSLLSEPEGKVIAKVYGVTEKGNFLDHSDPEPLRDLNVLSLVDLAKPLTSEEEVLKLSALGKMRTHRAKKVQPAIDDKILTSWNGLMITGLAHAGATFGEKRYLEAAKTAHQFVKGALWDEKKRVLYHRWKDGERDSSQQAESYLSFLRASRNLYEVTLDPEYLEFAVALAEVTRDLLYDPKGGGFYDSPGGDDVVLRLKDDFDSAQPTPTSLGAMEFTVLAEITGREDLREVAQTTFKGYAKVLKEAPNSLSAMVLALDLASGEPKRLVITDGTGKERWLQHVWQSPRRNLIVLGNRGLVEEFTRGLKAQDGVATGYLCEGKTCRPPETDPSKVILEEGPELAPPAAETKADESNE
jgi:uncharacterized protein YyaL (SSP411 family)